MSSTFRKELIIGSEIYGEELKRKIENLQRELSRVEALKKEFETSSEDSSIVELNLEHQLYNKAKRNESNQKKKENSVFEDRPDYIFKKYVDNEVSFNKLFKSYLKIVRNKEKRPDKSEVIDRKVHTTYDSLHRPVTIYRRVAVVDNNKYTPVSGNFSDSDDETD